MLASNGGGGLVTPTVCAAILIDIVAGVQDDIDGLIAGDGVIGVEEAEGVIGAGRERDAQAVE